MIVVGLAGASRAGKDTVAKRLIERHGFQRVAFADPVKYVYGSIDPIISNDGVHFNEAITSWDEDHVKENYPEYVKGLVALGMAIRDLYPDFWAEVGASQIIDSFGEEGPGHRYVYTDVRFENEVEVLRHIPNLDRSAHVEVWKVGRREAEAAARATGRPSEKLFDEFSAWDRVVDNNRDLDFLHLQIDGIAQHIFKEHQ